MEMTKKGKAMLKTFVLVIFSLICFCACHKVGGGEQFSVYKVFPSQHSLLVLTPGVGLRTTGKMLNTQYLRFRSGHEFPFIGVLQVDGKSYRFMGGDSLRIKKLAPMLCNGDGWETKYTFLYPGNKWKEPDYDDLHWKSGLGPLGSDNLESVKTFWGASNLYSRRHIVLNKDSIRGRKLYIQYICDDSLALYMDGKRFLDAGLTFSVICKDISNEDILEKEGDSHVISAYAYDDGGFAYMDYGIYLEDTTYRNIDIACLKYMDVRASQTFYVFQCGNVELRVDFTSPSFWDDPQMCGMPASFLTYCAKATDGQQHDVRILFDVDTEWLYNNVETENFIEKNWKMIRIGNCMGKLWDFEEDGRPTWSNIYFCMRADEMTQTFREGHMVLTQQLNEETSDRGILLLGNDEKYALQYFGDNIHPYWNKEGKRAVKEVLVEVGDQYEKIKQDCNRMDMEWSDQAFRHGGTRWLEKSIPFCRDFMGEHRLAISSNGNLLCFCDTVGNVRAAYEHFPLLQFFNRADLMEALLQPVFDKSEKVDWPKKFPPCDVGCYPIAIQQASLKDYSVKVAADMLKMTSDIVNTKKNIRYAKCHWEVLSQWNGYLENEKSEIEAANPIIGMGAEAYKKLLEWN